jgi:hexosaminidase
MNVKYSRGSFNTEISTVFNQKIKKNQIVLTSETKGTQIHYTLDGTDPTTGSSAYTVPFEISESCTVKAVLSKNNKIIGPINSRDFIVSKAYGKPVEIKLPYSFKYPASGNQAMTDGLLGTNSYKLGWQGYEGSDMEIIIDLEKPEKVSFIKMRVVTDPNAWILFPQEIVASISDDKEVWTNIGKCTFDNSTPSDKILSIADMKIKTTKARFIKIKAKNQTELPEWHPYKGQPSWIFFDELIVE